MDRWWQTPDENNGESEAGRDEDRESFKAYAGCYHRDGRQARRIPVDARLDLRTVRQVHTNTNCRNVTGSQRGPYSDDRDRVVAGLSLSET